MPQLAASAAVARVPVPQAVRAASRGRPAVRPPIVNASPRARRAIATPRVVRVVALTRREVDKTSHITAALLPLAAAVALIIDPLASARWVLTIPVAGDLAVLTARLVGALCLSLSLLPVAMAADDTPPMFRASAALMLSFVAGLVLFLTSGNLHLLTPAGRAVLFTTSGFLAAVYGTLVVVGFF